MTGLMPSLMNWKVTMTNRTLSPAAQAVLDASNLHPCYDSRQILAAALQAAADQVVPPEQERLFIEERPWDVELGGVVDIRQQLLAIAAELKGKALPEPALRDPGCDKTSTSIHQ